jgi:uncharacterized Zn finger protein
MAKRSSKTAPGMPRFDVDRLRAVAGGKVFERGVEYFEDDQVEIISVDKTRVVAEVLGSEAYRTELIGTGRDFSGDCSCPAFPEWGFCKHLVATALAANAVKPGDVASTESGIEKIRRHLRGMGLEALIGLITGLAERDPALRREIELAAATEADDDTALFVRFKKMITEATRISGFLDYRAVRGWAQGVRTALDRVEGLIDRGRARIVLDLLDYLFTRLGEALESGDDSNGDIGGIFERACEIHRAACARAKPDPTTLARDLFAREVESGWDFFAGASESYADSLGETGLAEYRRLADAAWQKVKPRRAGRTQDLGAEFGRRYQLRAILESFAARDGDLDRRIALRAQDLSGSHDYLGIAQLCLEHGRDAQALKWAEDGLWQFEDSPDERLVFFAADLYGKSGRQTDADRLLWLGFERQPSRALYDRLKGLSKGDARIATEVRDRAVSLLRAAATGDTPRGRPRWGAPDRLMLDIMMTDGLLTEAWDHVRVHGCADEVREALAKASEQSHPAEALQAYQHRVERLVSHGGNVNYDAAFRLIERMAPIRKRLGQASEHAAYVADLMARHKAKRNFIKLLSVIGR